jgi:hypothetical protein
VRFANRERHQVVGDEARFAAQPDAGVVTEMAKSNLTRNFHDSHLERVVVGPRNEVTLFVHLDPVCNRGVAETVAVRFGAIVNFEDVEKFFSGIRPPDLRGAFLAELLQLSPHGKGKWLVDVDGYGPIEIQSSKCTEL